MSVRPFRFVHAADFHLELPLSGMAEIPPHLRDAIIDAPYTAAQRVFDCALHEEAEFVVLSGDLVHPHRAGPRGIAFLLEQFQRLAARKIAVYWAGGAVDSPDTWPAWATLPENVQVFPRARVGEFVHERDGAPLVRLVGQAGDGKRTVTGEGFTRDPMGLFTIGVAHGPADAAALAALGLNYWALGGRRVRSTLFAAPHTAHWPGSPQGRTPQETGPHGCTVVQVDADQHVKLTPASADAIRWHSERVAVDDNTAVDDLRALLHERLQSLMDMAPGAPQLVCWSVRCGGLLWRQLRRGNLAEQLLHELRGEDGPCPPAAWSAALAAESSGELPAELYEQESLLGDYLRSVRRLQINAALPIDLSGYCERRLPAGLEGIAAVSAEAARERALREASWLGMDLLSGEESQA